MDFGTWLIGAVVAGVVLFLWSGLTQNLLPWGVKSVQEPTNPEALGKTIANGTKSGVYYFTNQVAAFVAVKPASYYSIPRYFAVEFVMQLLVGMVLSGILLLTADLEDGDRILIIGLAALAGILSVDGQYWNWWGFSTIYSLGVAANRLTGYVIATGILLALVF